MADNIENRSHNLQQDYENIIPWNGSADRGRDVRLKWQRNLDKIKNNFEQILLSLQDKLSSTDDSTAAGVITFLKGWISENFTKGSNGSGLYKDEQGNWHLESDYMHVSKKFTAEEVEIQHTSHIGGKLMNTAANLKCIKIEVYDTYYRCYMRTEDSDGNIVRNLFDIGDFAYCETFNLYQQADGTIGNHFYWREVIDKGTDYIDLSIALCASGSDIPLEGDNIELLGSKITGRQGAIIMASAGDGSPYFRIYKGINSFTLPSPRIDLNPEESRICAKFISETTGEDLEEIIGTINYKLDLVKEQTDKEYTIWFFDYNPTLTNIPASDWNTDELKTLHEYDMFYNKTTGYAWRFENGNWVAITDAQTIKALEEANKANSAIKDMSDDDKVAPTEKIQLKKEIDIIKAEEPSLISMASVYSLSTTNYVNSYNTLITYTDTILADMESTSTIVGTTFRTYFSNYYGEKQVLLNAINGKNKNLADNAQSDATSALNKLDDIASDDKFTASEKQSVSNTIEGIKDEYTTYIAAANLYLIATADYTTKYNALVTYITPLLNSLTTTSDIIGTTFKTKFSEYYTERGKLIKSIDSINKTKTDDAQKTADNKKRIFVAQPTSDSIYDVGDMWVNATYDDGTTEYDNDSLVCITSKVSGAAFSISHWQPSQKTTSATIKNLGTEIDLFVKKFSFDASGKVTNISTSGLVTTSGFNTLLSQKVTFDGSGDITNISKSGLVTTDNFSQLLANKVTIVDGKVTNISTSGLVATTDFNSYKTEIANKGYLDKSGVLSQIQAKIDDGTIMEVEAFSGMFATAIDGNTDIVKSAQIAAFVTSDEVGNLISQATIQADKINFIGKTIINDKFIVDDDGNVTMNDVTMNNAVVTGVFQTFLNGKRIILNSTTNSFEMYDSNNKKIVNMGFIEGSDGRTAPSLVMYKYFSSGEPDIISILPNAITMNMRFSNDRYDFNLNPFTGLTFYKNNSQTKKYPIQ